MRTRYLVPLVLVGLVLSMASAMAAPLDPNGTFVDDDGSIFESSIEAIADAGITKGCNPPANDAYCPELSVTRAEMATFLVRALRYRSALLIKAPPNAFVDDEGSIHEPDIDLIAALGVTRGCNPPTNDRFCPDDPVSREQMAAFLARAFGFTDDDLTDNRFIDDDGSIFETDIEAIASEGVTLGCNPPTNDRYCPRDLVTRGQMAAFLTRALGLTPLPPPSVSEAALVRPVFLLDQPSGGPFLATFARYVEPGDDTPTTALEKLLEGPNAGELAQSPAVSTAVPAGSSLNSLTVVGGVALADLSEEFDDGGGSASMFARLGQLTFTLTQFDTIDEVTLALDGVPVTIFSSEGIDISGGLDESYFFDLGVMPEILPLAPAGFEFVESPIDVTGWSRAFEATINWELYDNDGLLLEEGFETTGSGGPDFGVMSFDVSYTVSSRQLGSLMVFEISAKDGSRIFLREVPIWLEP